MVTTFNDRIIYLTKTVVPLVGKPSALNNPLNRDKNAPSIGMKRQAPSAYARPMYQYTPPSRYTSAAEAKRRRLKDELHYTAATVQQALANAGRPPVSILTCRARALPRTVNTDGCMLISSKEYDASDAVAEETTTASANADDAQDEQSSVDEMHLYASLIQSTRHFYRLEDSSSLTTHNSNNKEDDIGDNDDDVDDDDEELRASSDATSTWAPSSTCNNVNLNDKKTIDNDNRSDGTSSNPASSTSGEEETSDLSLSDQCEGDEASPSPPVPEKENCSADGNLIDNKSNSSNDLNNDENHNNDGVEDNYDDLTQVCFVVG